MNVHILVAPHEREEVIHTYADRLTADDIGRIRRAPENATIRFSLGDGFTAINAIPAK